MRFENGILVEYNKRFVVHLIPKSNKTSRPQYNLNPKHITIHNTANPGATAEQNSIYVDNTTDYVSWHFTVGDGVVYQELPINEVSWHAGDGSEGEGNRNSISIEVSEVDGAYETAVQFTKDLMGYLSFTSNQVYPHKHWSGKECPRLILPIWNEFIFDLNKVDWKEDLITYGMEEGLITEYHKPDEVVEYWALMAIFKN